MWRTARLSGRVSQYWSFFDPAYLFLTGGYANVVNSTRHVGVFPMSFLALIPIGVAALVRRGARSSTRWCSRPSRRRRWRHASRSRSLTPSIGSSSCCPSARCSPSLARAIWQPCTARAWRTAGVLLLAAVPLHFVFFSVDYYRDYPRSAAFWFNWNSRDAIAALIALEPQRRPATIYLSTRHVSNLEAYWRLYLNSYGRLDLLQRTVPFDSEGFDVQSIPPGSLLLAGRDDTALTASIDAGLLRLLAAIPEPADPPFFSIFDPDTRWAPDG